MTEVPPGAHDPLDEGPGGATPHGAGATGPADGGPVDGRRDDPALSFTVTLHTQGDAGTLEWNGLADADTLERAVSLAADDALVARGLARVEVQVDAADSPAIRALHRAGFRREGRRRQAIVDADGTRRDALLYARLATDQVYGPSTFSAVMDSVLPTKRVIGHVLFTDEQGRVLLLETSYKSDWELPGGIVEAGEPPVLGCEREVLEELGLTIHLGAPRMVDWMPPYLGWSDAIEFLWHGGVLPAGEGFRLPDSEIRAYHWVPRDEVATRVTPLSARRIALLLDESGPLFTVDGVPLG